MDVNFFYEFVGSYGLIAIFFLAAIEGDITLLLAGVLAHGFFFGDYSFGKVLIAGTLGGFLSDQVAYFLGRRLHAGVSEYKFYARVRTRVERLTENFGALSIFLSKYIYGLRTALCVFYGVTQMKYRRFALLSFASCFVWVFLLSGAGYFFHGAVTNLIGDFHHIGVALLVIVVLGVGGFYLLERYWLAKKVEDANPESVQRIEDLAQERLQEIGQEIQEHNPISAIKRRQELRLKRRQKTAHENAGQQNTGQQNTVRQTNGKRAKLTARRKTLPPSLSSPSSTPPLSPAKRRAEDLPYKEDLL